MKLIDYVESVEIKTDDVNKLRFYFGEQPTLRDRRIIYALHHAYNGFITPTGRTSIGNAKYQSFLVLVSKGREVINRYPLDYIAFEGYQFRAYIPIFIDRVIDWPKSYVELCNGTNLSATESFYFSFLCADRPKDPPTGIGLNIEVIEIKTNPITVTKFAFPDHENLRNKTITKIGYIFNRTNITKGPSNNDIVNDTVRNKSVLTMSSKGMEIIKKMPLAIFDIRFMYFNSIVLNFTPDLPNCYMEVPNTTGLVADEVYVFFLYYYDKIIGKK